MSSTMRLRRRSGIQNRSQRRSGEPGTAAGSAPPVERGLVTRRIVRVLRVGNLATKYKDNKIAFTRTQRERAAI